MKAHFTRNTILAVVALAGMAVLMAQTVLPDDKPNPGGANLTQGGKDYIVQNPEIQSVRQMPALAVREAEIYKVGEKSEIGKPGDYVLLLKGQGFLGASLNPVVHIGKWELAETYLNAEMTELYVVISEKQWRELGQERWVGISVQNAGAHNEARDRWGTLKVEDAEWRKKIQAAESIHLFYSDYWVRASK